MQHSRIGDQYLSAFLNALDHIHVLECPMISSMFNDRLKYQHESWSVINPEGSVPSPPETRLGFRV
jgi:hypothetical protein